jgi:tetratricopeptide (TPR) repeat protein
MKQWLLSIIWLGITCCSNAQSWEEINDSLLYHYQNGNNKKATELGNLALLKAKGEFGEESKNYATSLNILGFLYDDLGNYGKAEPLYLQALSIRKKILGEEHPDYATSLNNLAGLYYNTGNYGKAEPLYLQALSIRKKTLGEEHPDYATSLNNLASLYDDMGDYTKAEIFYIQAMNIDKKVSGKEHPDYAISLNNLATLYVNMGNYSKAEPLHLEALQIRKKILGEEDPDYAQSLNNLAFLYASLGQFVKAEPLYIEALNIRKKVLGIAHPDYSNSLNNLALLYSRMGQFVKAEPLYIEALNIRKKILGEEHPDYATSLSNMASLLANMGNYLRAESLYIEALNIRKKVLGEEHLVYAASLSSLGLLYERTGNFSKAKLFFEKALNIRKRILGEEHPDYAQSLNNLALLYISTGNYMKAELLYVQAKNIYKKVLGEEHPDYATALSNLAGMYKDMGSYDKAKPLYEEALAIRKKKLGEEHPDYATSLNNLAGIEANRGYYAKADSLYTEAKTIYKKVLGEEHPSYATTLNNLAGIYESTGQFTRAEPLYLEALTICRKTPGEESASYATSLNNLGYLYKKMSNYSKAEQFYTDALNVRKKVLGDEHPDYATSLNNLAGLFESISNFEKAEQFYINAFAISLKHSFANFANLSEKEKQAWLNDNEYFNESLLSLQYNYAGLSDSARRFILNQQLLLKSIVLSDSKHILQTIQNSKDSILQKTYSSWISIKNELSQQYSLPPGKRNSTFKNREQQAEDLEKQLNAESSVFRQQQQSLRIKTTDVQNGLQEEEATIEFTRFQLYNKNWTDSIMYAAYILTKNDSIPVYVPLCEERQLQKLFDSAGTTADAMVSKFYRGLDMGNTGTAASLGVDLYKLVWAPLEPYLNGIKTVSYSPAGKLYNIAFHALPSDSNTLLMDKYQLNQYTSTRQVALRKTHGTNSKIQSITLFGNAAFTLDSSEIARSQTGNSNISNVYTPQNQGSSWTDLPGTAEEVKKIKRLFDQNKISTNSFTQTAASEDKLKALSGKSPQVLHIATHGFFLPEPGKKRKDIGLGNENTYSFADDPLLRSGLILAGGNYAWSGKAPIEGVEDGIATAYEISQLNLSNTELVVLSACETALGDVKGSEGVFGLQRAFKMAGVKKMIVSLWQVPDKETAELMTTFYTYWLKGKTIEQAFARAQADMRKKYSPFYWAAFVLVE